MLAFMFAARDVEAASMAASVFELTAEVMPDVWVFVLLLICEVMDDEAVCKFPSVAKEPESRVASVKRRVAAPHTLVAVSETRVPNESSVLPP